MLNESIFDLCDLNQLKCLNNGVCTFNILLNTSSCQCDACHNGILCENLIWRQGHFDTTYVYYIVSIIGVFFSILNNGLIFELFLCCRRIRCTNCGIYLFVYSILSLLSNILLLTDQSVQYYPNELINNTNEYSIFHCYVTTIGYNAFLYLCIWFSSCIAFERGLTIWFYSKINPTRWRSCFTIIFILALGIGSATPLLLYKCDWDTMPSLQILHIFFVWFYIITGILIYLVTTVIVLISFAGRIHDYGMEDGSCIKTFFKLLKSHLFIFVPPVAYVICQLPYTIVVNTTNPGSSYFECGISTGEFIIKVIMESLTNTPYALTWLLFVYPSKVYMKEFYLNTWSGQRLANIIIFFKSYNYREENVLLSLRSSPNNEDDNP